jgi:hypothetical protein
VAAAVNKPLFINSRILLFAISLLCHGVTITAQKGPVAKFSFNDSKDYDEVSHKKAKLIGTNFTTDRFGNENHAVYIAGNKSSYINLGQYPALKPKAGSISLWVKMEHPIWSGRGGLYNPIIITKYTRLNDFYESYVIYYMLEPGRLIAGTVQDSTNEVFSHGLSTFKRNSWQHIVLSFDYDSLGLYLNGRLQSKLAKKFETRYLDSDSVVLGGTANGKNSRFFNGYIDDLEIYDRVLTREEISALYHAPNPNRHKVLLNWLLAGALALLFAFVLYLLIKQQVKKGVLKEKKRFEFYNLVLETELRVNRALMNPHFIFNSLNTLQNFILKQDHHTANDYLVEFSKLLRKTLESNNSGIISLELELDLLKRYIDIENLRFEKNITYTVEVDTDMAASAIYIPIMMLQPFLENAIWHGLLNKQGDKRLKLIISQLDSKHLKCVIDDNGLGRKKKEPASGEKKSMGINFIQQRLSLLNKIHHLNCSLNIEDKEKESGTTVTIILPILTR